MKYRLTYLYQDGGVNAVKSVIFNVTGYLPDKKAKVRMNLWLSRKNKTFNRKKQTHEAEYCRFIVLVRIDQEEKTTQIALGCA